MTANGLAKLLEELGELSQVAAKRLAYFHTTEHPDGAGDLNERMQQEMGDVLAACSFVASKFQLDDEAIEARWAQKIDLFEQWDADNTNGGDCFHAPKADERGSAEPTDEAIEDFLATRMDKEGRVPFLKTIREALSHFAPARDGSEPGLTVEWFTSLVNRMCDETDEPWYGGYESPHTFDDGVVALADAIKAALAARASAGRANK